MKLYKSKDMCAEWAAPIYEEMGWRWNDGKNIYFVPTKKDILDSLKRLETILKEEYLDWDSSGRLIVTKVIDTGEILFGIDGESYDEYSIQELKKR